MNTTTAFIEIVVIGFFALGSIALGVSSHGGSIEVISRATALLKDHSVAFALAFGCCCYFVGWLVNTVATRLSEAFGVLSQVRTRIFTENNSAPYQHARAYVLQHGAPALVSDLQTDRARIRLARASVLNFSFLCAVAIGSGHLCMAVGAIGVVAISAHQFGHMWKRYYTRMAQAYCALTRAPSVPERGGAEPERTGAGRTGAAA